MSLLMLVFWALVIFGGVSLFRRARHNDQRLIVADDGRPEAQSLLDERFARGEIDAEEYGRRRELLRSGR